MVPGVFSYTLLESKVCNYTEVKTHFCVILIFLSKTTLFPNIKNLNPEFFENFEAFLLRESKTESYFPETEYLFPEN